MSDNALNTLFLPFEKNVLTPPDGRVVFFGARAHTALAGFGDIQMVQHFYPYAAALDLPAWDGEGGADMALVLLPKQKEEAQYDLAQAQGAVKDGGMIIVAASNDAGGGRIEKWMTEMGLTAQSLSKSRARVCWASVSAGGSDVAAQWVGAGTRRRVLIEGQEWVSQPGVFGWNRMDTGSRMLLDHIPTTLKGVGADFGCGYGYLTRAALRDNESIDAIICIDADRRAVECAGENIDDPRASFIWGDLSAPIDGIANLDFIVMNPPFHEGKTTTPALGQDFIRTARASLRKGGVLYMVANAKLDYESVLKSAFAHGEKLAEAGGFKIYSARA